MEEVGEELSSDWSSLLLLLKSDWLKTEELLSDGLLGQQHSNLLVIGVLSFGCLG